MPADRCRSISSCRHPPWPLHKIPAQTRMSHLQLHPLLKMAHSNSRGHPTFCPITPRGARGCGPRFTGPLGLLELIRMLHGSPRDMYSLKMRAVLELVQLSYLPMVVTPGPDPSGMHGKPSQLVAGGFLEPPSHIGHVSEWCQLFNVKPLSIFAFIHSPDELIQIIIPLWVIERGDLGGVETRHYMYYIPSPS